MGTNKSRLHWLDNLRWFTVFLVLVYHVFYLFNNKGVMKMDGEPETLDPQRTANVKIDFHRLKVQSVKEIRSERECMT